MRAALADGVTDHNWSEKGREICGLFAAYGDREFQGEVLYRTKLHGEDGISFYFDDGYTYACAVHVPHLNDFNTDLVEMRKGRSVEDLDRQRMAELEGAFEQSAEEEPEQGMEV